MSNYSTCFLLWLVSSAASATYRYNEDDVTLRDRYSTGEDGFTDGYEIVAPRKVGCDGKFVSHRIPHRFEPSFDDGRTRRNETPTKDALHYRLRIEDAEHHIELYPSRRLIGPGAVIEDHGGDDFLDDFDVRRIRDTNCHYRGHVRGEAEITALSTCYGLAGYIRTRSAWYAIEPLTRDHDDDQKEAEQLHVVRKKRMVAGSCNVVDKNPPTRIRAERLANSRSERDRRRDEPRTRPTAGSSYTIELLVVLDKQLLDYHRDFDVLNYALTLLNMAAGLFHDASLGVEMELTIVRIIRLQVEEDEMNLTLNKDAEETLKNFQEWQRRMNPGDDSHPNHHDCAILITKANVCVSRNLCGFTGVSTIAGTCDPTKGAVVVRDNGLQTGYHIAHQIGHTLGMSHDVEEENGCRGIAHYPRGVVETTVMHPGSVYVTKKWSKCSRNYIKLFIEEGHAHCLADEPQDHRFPLVEMLPGVVYNGDHQCRLRYRQDVVQCDLGATCEILRCAVPGKGCVSGRKPPADGTPCGEKRWCYHMKCLMVGERPGAVDGGWGSWSPWSRCSRSCGSGVASSSRRCDRPSPSKGGAYCSGNRKRHKICATNPCEIGAPSFRDVQCAEFNDWVFPEDGKIHQWIAYNLPENLRASENPCALYCLSETKLVTSLKPKVIDGTTCYRGIRDICIGGICKEIPCDLNMESNAVEDVCGVCKGNGTSCILKEGTVTVEAQSQPRKILDVPIGSRNIRVEETEPTRSRIAVRGKKAGMTLIDGEHLGMFDVPGTKAWLGMIRPRQEALNIPGPVTEELVVLVYPRENVTLKYSLGLSQNGTRKAAFSWKFVDWEPCTAVCGSGEQISKPRCIERIGGLVDDRHCRNILKPEVKLRPCYQAPCVPRWMIGDWQGCEVCTPDCKRIRTVKCVRPIGRGDQDLDVLEDENCQWPKPREREPCTESSRRNDRDDRNHRFHDRKSRESQGHRARPSSFGSLELIGTEPRSSSRRLEEAKPRDVSRLLSRKEKREDGKLDENSVVWSETKTENERHRTDDEKSDEEKEESDEEKEAVRSRKIVRSKKDRVVIDKEDVTNLTLTIIVERDEDDNAMNFPKDFEPQPPTNCTELVLVGMDAIRYIQSIEKETPLRRGASWLPGDRTTLRLV